MEDNYENHLQMVALCKSMGNLSSEEDITELLDKMPDKEKQESELILYGKLFSRPNVNFQAFLAQ